MGRLQQTIVSDKTVDRSSVSAGIGSGRKNGENARILVGRGWESRYYMART